MNREATAFHEAGHAVVAFFNGFRIDYATIRQNGDYHGMVMVKPRGRLDLDSATPAMRQKVERWIIFVLAGDVAQRKFAPRSSRRWHTTSDRASAVDLALSVCGSGESATAYLAWLQIVTRDIVDRRWPMIERVARELLAKEKITGEEVRAAIMAR
jgi:hypothetical protein